MWFAPLIYILFNSRPLVEVDAFSIRISPVFRFFNSRPLVEVDCNAFACFCRICFSTHDLSQRSTDRKLEAQNYFNFSTHDLSQRSTYFVPFVCLLRLFFNSRPLVEVDRCQLLQISALYFQLTTSRRGRPQSVHLEDRFCIFQLTTSRGGRQQNFTINH